MEQYRRISKKDFIQMVQDNYPDDLVLVYTTDFNEGLSDSGKMETKETVGVIANESKAIIFTGNELVAHVDLHSVAQNDIEHIQAKGVMKTIMVSP